MPQRKWFLDKEEFIRRYEKAGNSILGLHRETGIPETTLRRWRDKHKVSAEAQTPVQVKTITGDKAIIISKNNENIRSPDELIKLRGLNPDDWVIEAVSLTEWESNSGEGTKIPLHRMKLTLKRKHPINFILPARIPGKVFKPKPVKKQKSIPQLGVFVGDHQIQGHKKGYDHNLHTLFCQWLSVNKPDFGMIIGDFVDLQEPSRHPTQPDVESPVMEGIDAGYLVFRDYIESYTDCVWEALMGNHDERVKTAVIKHLKWLYGIRRALKPGEDYEESVLNIEYLMRFDELNIKLIKPEGPYTHAQRSYNETLVARHGWITGKNVAEKSIERLMHSLIFGHTHGMSTNTKTVYYPDGTHKTIRSIENPVMCKIQKGLGYAVDPNWVNGFTTVFIWDDGRFSVEQAFYENGVLTWQDQRFET